MSIEQPDIVDILSIDSHTGDVVLTVSDHVDWSESTAHQALLQEKLNRYLAFVESDEILQRYPDARDRSTVFKIVFKHAPDQAGRAFLQRAKQIVETAGFRLSVEVFAAS